MLIGLDLDNTIVSYETVFAELARARGVPELIAGSGKTRIRDYLRGLGQEEVWTEMQGEAYGPKMERASAFPGLEEFLTHASRAGHRTVIISHRSPRPYRGTAFDLHASAISWWNARSYAALVSNLFLEPAAEAKAIRIQTEGCNVFIDDLPEFLERTDLPSGLRKIWLDHSGLSKAKAGLEKASSWEDVTKLLLS